MHGFPLNYVTSEGTKAAAILPLTKGVTAISLVVIVIIAALILTAIFRRRAAGGPQDLVQDVTPLRWIYIGTGLTVAVLLGVLVWTMTTVAAVVNPKDEPALSLDVTGHQWWWEVRYLDKNHPSNIFNTANEIHIPVGKPIRINLKSADVIHSFWVPALSGKTDMIPGQVNTIWLQADRPGTYRGQCTEYCGQQHAHMGFTVIADEAQKFEAWRLTQIRGDAPQANDPSPIADGRQTFTTHCGACHTVRGTGAGGIVGPDLTHIMSRSTIAAGTLPNKPGWLAGWIADPQHVKPGAKMPILDISGPELHAVTTYLATLN
ncbi:cytochrome c oxidase subunit II [Methyloferula stellata]|uniref:cytochrome c oxidase subunit II n=1 Tax=Methyloferula stellata TaxID=876270 RepID=UPI0003A1989E|nr:cytochrome c oxidase subunit II [Methyloferula stellata]